MRSAKPAKDLTRKAFAIWTAVATLFLGLTVWAITSRSVDALTGAIFFFFPTIIVALCLSWTGQGQRLLAGVLATLLVAFWPIYRWVALGDWRSVSVFLYIAGFFNALLFGITAIEFARRRWGAVESPGRRRLVTGAMVIYATSAVLHWPTGVWHYVVFVGCTAVFLLTHFWPPRRRLTQA